MIPKALAANGVSLGLGLMMLMASPLMQVYGTVALVFAAIAFVPFICGWLWLTAAHYRRAMLLGFGFAASFFAAQAHVQVTSLRNAYLDALTIGLGALTFLIFVSLVRQRRQSWFVWVSDAGLIGTLITAAAAFLSGSVQFAGAMAAALLVVQILYWAPRRSRGAIGARAVALTLACVIPLLLSLAFHIGHALALPWICCHLAGATMLWVDFLRHAATKE